MADDDDRAPSASYPVYEDASTPDDDPSPTRSGPDPIGLLAGLAALVVAVLALTDSLHVLDPRWALALAAIGAGAVLILATLRRRRT